MSAELLAQLKSLTSAGTPTLLQSFLTGIRDLVFMAVVAWKENRGAGYVGMQSVINVVMNRSRRDNISPYAECVRRLQFSSLTAKADPELILWPEDGDTSFLTALMIAALALLGSLTDLTRGAVDYYAPQSIKTETTITLPNGQTIPFPEGWNAAELDYTVTIGGQVFFADVEKS